MAKEDVRQQYRLFGTNQVGEVPPDILERRQKQIDDTEKLKKIVKRGAAAAAALGIAAGATDIVVDRSSHDSTSQGNTEAISPTRASSTLESGGKKFNVKDSRDHPAGAEITELAPNGQAVDEYVAWDQLTPAQQLEANSKDAPGGIYSEEQPK